MRRSVVAVVAVLAVGLTACGSPTESAETETTTGSDQVSTTTGPATPTSAGSTPTTEAEMPNQSVAVAAATSHLAARSSLNEEAITIVKVEPTQFSDGSLGCPREGEAYTQAVVDGFRILLEGDGRIYDYRADQAGTVILCPSDEKDGGYDFVPPPGLDD